jgi:hypothetical protein
MLTSATQVPAFTIFTPKIFLPRIPNHFFKFGFCSFSFVLIRVNSWFPFPSLPRDFHASKTAHFALCALHFALIKPAWYRIISLRTAKPNFFTTLACSFNQSTFAPLCHTSSAGQVLPKTCHPSGEELRHIAPCYSWEAGERRRRILNSSSRRRRSPRVTDSPRLPRIGAPVTSHQAFLATITYSACACTSAGNRIWSAVCGRRWLYK